MSRHRPYTVKIELVRGCSMRCPFCALPEMHWADDPWEFMSEEIFQMVVRDIVEEWPKIRIEFAERGEMTFHPKLAEYIRYMRKKIPLAQITITSNGDMLRKLRGGGESFVTWVNSLLDDGLNIMMLDCYTSERYTLFKRLFPNAKLFYEDNYHPYRYMGPKERTVLLVDGEHGANHKIRRWHNSAGSVNAARAHAAGYEVNTITEPLEKMCVRPFREIEVHWDGTVPICCNDWKEDAVVGNVTDATLGVLWDDLDVYREPLLRKARREIHPCNVCSERAGFRVGLEMRWFE